MAIQGLRDSSNFATDERPKNWRQGIMLLYPNGEAPLTALTSMMKSEKTDDPQYHWWTKGFNTQRLQISANVTTGASTISVNSGGLGLKAGHILRIESTEEIVRVASDPASDTSVTVTRGFGETAATSLTLSGNNPYLHVIGTAYEEGSDAPTGINYDPVKLYNYTQIFRNTFESTRTASKTRLRTKDNVTEAKRECLELHSTEMEKAFIFGERLETTVNGKPIRTTRGLVNWIDSGNVVTAPAAGADMEWLEEQMFNMFLFGSSEKMVFCGNRALLTIQQIIRKNSHFNIESGLKEYGMNVKRLTCPFGDLVIKTHPLFNQLSDDAYTTTETATDVVYRSLISDFQVYDMANLKYRYLSGDDTRYEKKLQSNGMDGLKSGYISECGMEVHHPTTHYRIKGLGYAKADS